MSQRVELDLLRRLEAMTVERDEALAKADQYKRDWYAAKSEFGSAMAKMREALRAVEVYRKADSALTTNKVEE